MEIAWVTAPIAALALWIAYFNFCRANYVTVRVLEISTGFQATIEQGQYYQLRIVIQNLGIPIHDIFMKLNYRGHDGFGQISLPLEGRKGTSTGQFAKGMITEFVMISNKQDQGASMMLSTIEDPGFQKVCLSLYASGYPAWKYRFVDRLQWIKCKWNIWSSWVQHRYLRRHVITSRGAQGIKYIWTFRRFSTPVLDLMNFVEHFKKQQATRKNELDEQ